MPTIYDVYSVSEALVRRTAYLNDFRINSPLPDTPGDPQYFMLYRSGDPQYFMLYRSGSRDIRVFVAMPIGYLQAIEWMEELREDQWVYPGNVAEAEAIYLPLLLEPGLANKFKTDAFIYRPDKIGTGDSRTLQHEIYRVYLADEVYPDHSCSFVITRGPIVKAKVHRIQVLAAILDNLGIPLTGWHPTNEPSRFITERRDWRFGQR